MERRIMSGRLGGYREPMIGPILHQIAELRGPNHGNKITEAEKAAIKNLSEELRRINPSFTPR